MDLLALLLSSHSLTIHRLAWERLFSLQLTPSPPPPPHLTPPPSPHPPTPLPWSPTAVLWRPDGKALVIACNDGSVQLVGMESRVVESHSHPHPHPITRMQWLHVTGSAPPPLSHSRRPFAPLPPLPSSSSAPTPSSASPSDAPSSLPPITCDADSQPPTLLLTTDASAFLHASLHGTLDVLHIDLRLCLPPSPSPLPTLSVLSFAPSPSFDSLHVAVRTDERVLVLRLCLSPLTSLIPHLSLLSAEVQHVHRLLSYTSTSLAAVTSRYHSIRQSLKNKFGPLAQGEADSEQAGQESVAVCGLIQWVLTGGCSASVQRWVSSYLSPAALMRQCAGVEGGLQRMMDVMRVNVRRAVEEVLYRLTDIRGWARWKETGEGMGIQPDQVTRLLEEAALVLLRVEEVTALMGRARRAFTAFFHWLASEVEGMQRDDEGEGEKGIPEGPFDVDGVLECIQLDLFTDRLALPLSSTAPPNPPTSRPPPSLTPPSPPVSLIPAAEASTSLLTALEALHTSFTAFTLTPCASLSAAVLQAQRRSDEDVVVLKEANVGLGLGVGDEDVALYPDPKHRRMLTALSFVHPLIPHPLLVVTSTPMESSTRAAAVYRVWACPGLSESSHASVVGVWLFDASRLLVLVRCVVARRSSELKVLQERERMIGNVYTRLHEVGVGKRAGWEKMRERERRQQGLSLADWVVGEWEAGRGSARGKAVVGKQRCLYGDCGRTLVVGRERGVCAVLLTALQPHRARQQLKRLVVLDLMEDAEQEQEQPQQQEEVRVGCHDDQRMSDR